MGSSMGLVVDWAGTNSIADIQQMSSESEGEFLLRDHLWMAVVGKEGNSVLSLVPFVKGFSFVESFPMVDPALFPIEALQ